MGDSPSHSPPSSSPSQKNNLTMLYYGLVVVATAALVLAVYNFLIIKWCARSSSQRQRPLANNGSTHTETSQTFLLTSRNLLETSSFKYKKQASNTNNDNVNNDTGCGDYELECSVCLSVFEEGEEVRQLPRCNHSFHAPCIDMWLYSHHDCPLCRAIVRINTTPPPSLPHRNVEMVGVL